MNAELSGLDRRARQERHYRWLSLVAHRPIWAELATREFWIEVVAGLLLWLAMGALFWGLWVATDDTAARQVLDSVK